MNVKSDNLTDVVFLVGGKQDRVVSHRLLLSLANDEFRKLFETNNDLEIPVLNLDTSAFKLVLSYIFTGNIILTKKNMLPVFEVATRYAVEHLLQHCSEYIAENISKQNLLTIFEFNKNYKNSVINKKCKQIIFEHPLYFFSLEEFQVSSVDFLSLLKEMENIDITERDLFKIAMKWSHLQRAGDAAELSESFQIYLMKHKPLPLKPQLTVSKSDSLKNFKYIEVDITGNLKYDLFPTVNDVSSLAFQMKDDVSLNMFGYYLGAPSDADKLVHIWVLLLEHKGKPSTVEDCDTSTTLYKKLVTYTYSKYLNFEIFQFDEDIPLLKNTIYEIRLVFNYDGCYNMDLNHQKISRYYLESKTVKVNNSSIMKIVSQDNLVIVSLSYRNS